MSSLEHPVGRRSGVPTRSGRVQPRRTLPRDRRDRALLRRSASHVPAGLRLAQPGSARWSKASAALKEWYADLDRRPAAALEALTEDEVANRRVTRHDFDVEGFAPLPAQELDIYREALLIFYGKVSIYLRAMGRELPRHWQEWIG